MLLPLAVLLPIRCFAAGTIAATTTDIGNDEYILTFTCTADASAATYPTSVTTGSASIDGWVTRVVTNPGSTAPTDNYDIALNDTGGDIMQGALNDRDTANTEDALPKDSSGAVGWKRVHSVIVPIITNNSENSAVTVIKVYYIKRTIEK